MATSTVLEPVVENIPADLRSTPRWVLWKVEARSRRPAKVPKRVTGTNARVSDPATWSTFDEVHDAYRDNPGTFSGVGFVFSADDALLGIDLDHCRDPETGEIAEPHASIVRELDSYTEVSPSGTGVKVFLRGEIPPGVRKQNHEIGLEMYQAGRYFTVTGRHVPGTPTSVNERSSQLEQLIRRFLVTPSETNANAESPGDNAGNINTARAALAALNPERADGYWTWLEVGMALHSVSDGLQDDWDEWSQQSRKYTAGCCHQKWRSFHRTSGASQVRLGTLIHYAVEDGWTPPWRSQRGHDQDDVSNGVIANCQTQEGANGSQPNRRWPSSWPSMGSSSMKRRSSTLSCCLTSAR